MPFDDGPSGATPEETGGAVAAHGDDDSDDATPARHQIGARATEEGRSANAAADAAEAEAAETD
jgi:hypothetical protein